MLTLLALTVNMRILEAVKNLAEKQKEVLNALLMQDIEQGVNFMKNASNTSITDAAKTSNQPLPEVIPCFLQYVCTEACLPCMSVSFLRLEQCHDSGSKVQCTSN